MLARLREKQMSIQEFNSTKYSCIAITLAFTLLLFLSIYLCNRGMVQPSGSINSCSQRSLGRVAHSHMSETPSPYSKGCHNLVAVGASGVLQAMVLSFGSFRFSNQHLEFNMQPKFLHREYFFRRLNYGNLTHVNVSVVLQEDNKAVLFVALDRSDKKYFACDGGCLGKPVQLRQEKVTFPVKLTDPVTAILYITYDKEHMELLQHTIHVNDVVEAPAQEHHVIALHRHGHHLGGLPTLFWVSVSFLIVIFHLFLFKLIYNEYCGVQDRYRGRYGKL